MPTYTQINLVTDKKKRRKFFEIYDDMICELKRSGLIESALTHAKNRQRIWNEVSLLD